jgi:hypothetical protein
MQQVSEDATGYRFEPTTTFFYEGLFAPPEQPPSPLGAVLSKLRTAVGPAGMIRKRASAVEIGTPPVTNAAATVPTARGTNLSSIAH